MQVDALSPCPFCGGAEATTMVYGMTSTKKAQVECATCGACGPLVLGVTHEVARADAEEAWNRRPVLGMTEAQKQAIRIMCEMWSYADGTRDGIKLKNLPDELKGLY